jgi:predicted Fe-S protein YdhL (DUF1289 family)
MSEIESIAQSPCVRNCCLNDDDICLGCFRSLEEITQWGESNNQERIIVLQNAQQRREANYQTSTKVEILLPPIRPNQIF